MTKTKFIKIFKKVAPIVLILIGVLVVLKTSHAANSYLGTEWDQYLEGNLNTFAEGGGTGEDLAIQFVRNLIRIVRYIIGGIALIMGTIYGMSLVFARGKEEAISKQKQNFLWVLLGFVILIVSENMANVIFNPENASQEKLINFNAAEDQLRDVITYIKYLLGSIFVLLMTVSSIRMITAGGDDEVITKQKKNLTWSLVGMLIILLASNIVNAIYVVKEPTEVIAAGPQPLINEIAGVVRLILVFLGPIAVAFTIMAGFYYLSALDNEERAQKAKRMIVGGVTGIVIVYAAYAIVNTVASSDLAFLPFTFIT